MAASIIETSDAELMERLMMRSFWNLAHNAKRNGCGRGPRGAAE